MKLQRLLIASAVCAAFTGTAYAQQQQDSQQGSQQDSQAQNSTEQRSLEQGVESEAAVDEATILQAQRKLQDAGYDVGPINGKWEEKSQDALRKFQQAQGMDATGELDQQTLSALGVQGDESFAEQLDPKKSEEDADAGAGAGNDPSTGGAGTGDSTTQ